MKIGPITGLIMAINEVKEKIATATTRRRLDGIGGIRVIVCGGRDFNSRGHLWRVLGEVDAERRIEVVIQGGCPTGADRLAKQWAAMYRREVIEVPADWNGLGRSAGPVRNRKMAHEYSADLCIAFPGGRGTASMVREAEAVEGLKILQVELY